MFVSEGPHPPPGWVRWDFTTSQHAYNVRTSIDGEVVEIEQYNTGYLEPSSFSPVDLVTLGALAYLGVRLGVKAVSSIVAKRSAKRQALEGAACRADHAPATAGGPPRRLKWPRTWR